VSEKKKNHLRGLLDAPPYTPMGILSYGAQQAGNKGSALEGELGGIAMPNGGAAHEFSTTEWVPQLNAFANMPTLVQGQVGVPNMLKTGDMTGEQRRIAIARALMRMKQGQSLPTYDNALSADNAAWLRHMSYELFK